MSVWFEFGLTIFPLITNQTTNDRFIFLNAKPTKPNHKSFFFFVGLTWFAGSVLTCTPLNEGTSSLFVERKQGY